MSNPVIDQLQAKKDRMEAEARDEKAKQAAWTAFQTRMMIPVVEAARALAEADVKVIYCGSYGGREVRSLKQELSGGWCFEVKPTNVAIRFGGASSSGLSISFSRPTTRCSTMHYCVAVDGGDSTVMSHDEAISVMLEQVALRQPTDAELKRFEEEEVKKAQDKVAAKKIPNSAPVTGLPNPARKKAKPCPQ